MRKIMRNKKIKKKLSRLRDLIFSGILLLAPVFLSASLSISPSIYELKIPRGKSYTDAIRVINVGKAQIYVTAYLSDFLLDSEGKIEFFDAGTLEYSSAGHMRLNPTSFSLEPQEEKWVRFTLTIPPGLEGEYQAIIFFHTQGHRIPSPQGKQVVVAARIGVTVYAAVKPDINTSSEILNLFLRKDLTGPTFHYALIYHNSGNIHVRPTGKLKILDQKKKTVVSTPLNEKESSILRNSLRVFEGKFEGKPGFQGGLYTIQAAMDYGKAVLEVEKSLFLPGNQGIESFEVKYLPPGKDNETGRVIFSARPAGIEDKIALKNPANCFKLKSLDGQMSVDIPVKIVPAAKKSNPPGVEFQGKWTGTLKPGIFFAEIQLFLHPEHPLTSFYKLTVEKKP
jgi:hypothetical protein